MKLVDILHPMPVSRFLLRHFGQEFLHVTGTAGRFTPLLTDPGALAPAERTRHPMRLLLHDLEHVLEAPIAVARETATPEEPRRLDHDAIWLRIANTTELTLWDKALEKPDGAGRGMRMDDGDALYAPRGSWVHAVEQDGWLRIAIHNPTGQDLLAWLMELVKKHETFAKDIPRFAAPGIQAAYLREIRRAISGACRTPGLLALLTMRLNAIAPPRQYAAGPSLDEVHDDCVIDILSARQFTFARVDANSLMFRFNDGDIQLPLDAAQLLSFLEERSPVRVSEFFTTFSDEFDREELQSFLLAMAERGLLCLVPGP